MVRITAKIIVLWMLSVPLIEAQASPPKTTHQTTKMVNRQWTTKLKQNSWTNRRPFQFASPIVDEEKVYVGVERGIFYALARKKGRKRWEFQTQGAVHAAAAQAGEKVFVGDIKGMVYALNKADGKLLWVTKVGGEILADLTVIQNKLFVVNLSKVIVALDVNNGSLLWRGEVRGNEGDFTLRGASHPVLVGESLLVGYSDGSLVAYNPETGARRWTKQLGDPLARFHDVDSSVVLGDKLAYVTSADGRLFALDPASGEIVWKASIGSVNNASLSGSYLYVSAEGVVYALKADTGEILWEQDLQLPEISSPVLYQNWIAVVATKGKLYFLNRKTGDITFSLHVRGGSYGDPVVKGDQLYLLSNASRLYAYKFEK